MTTSVARPSRGFHCAQPIAVFGSYLVDLFSRSHDAIGVQPCFDGLCESDEACIYAPNFGAYQGEGDYLAAGTCVFVDGQVQGVRLYALPINGA